YSAWKKGLVLSFPTDLGGYARFAQSKKSKVTKKREPNKKEYIN
ncbi:14395_t:CDS:1, partial [Gigaspora margarita]